MTRQSATQHPGVLEAANLVSAVRRGWQQLHYLNPVPPAGCALTLDFEVRAAASALSLNATKDKAEADMDSKPTFVYVIYIESTAERVWQALTDPELAAPYWGHSNVSDWRQGSAWEHRRTDGSGVADVVGTVVESRPPTRLVATWADPGEQDGQEPSRVTFTIEPHEGTV